MVDPKHVMRLRIRKFQHTRRKFRKQNTKGHVSINNVTQTAPRNCVIKTLHTRGSLRGGTGFVSGEVVVEGPVSDDAGRDGLRKDHPRPEAEGPLRRHLWPGCCIARGRANFTGLVLGCIEAKICNKICVGKLSPRSTQCTPLHRLESNPKNEEDHGEKRTWPI